MHTLWLSAGLINPIHQKHSLVDKPLSLEAEGECRRKVGQICFLWRSGKTIFCPCLGLWELHSPGRAATYLLCWLRLCFSSWDFALISNKYLLLCYEMGFTQSWGNHDFRRAYLLLPLPCILCEGSSFVHEIISRAGKFQKCLNCYVHVKPYHTTVFCFACLVGWGFKVYIPLPRIKDRQAKRLLSFRHQAAHSAFDIQPPCPYVQSCAHITLPNCGKWKGKC